MNPNRNNRRGLVLLIVLGMLGLFSLLAVTYMVYSGQSRTSGILINRAKLQNPGKLVYDADIISLILRGASNNQNPFTGHSLLGDVYGRYPITGRIRGLGNTNNASTAAPTGANVVGRSNVIGAVGLPNDTTFCKIPLAYYDLEIRDPSNSDRELSPIDDTYNARVFTMLEGPLEGHSFRILKYIGNEDGVPSGGTNPVMNIDPARDPLSYSILIDFTELSQDAILRGSVNNGNSTFEHSGNLMSWIGSNNVGANALFYASTGTGYKYLINDAVYNGIGYGYNPGAPNPADTGAAGYERDLDPIGGNLTQYWTGTYQNRTDPIYQLATNPIPAKTMPNKDKFIPIGLLPHYDYVDKDNIIGGTNEGYDVADYRDYWLSNINPNGDNTVDPREIIPSYHRPELINYIYNRYIADTGVDSAKVQNVVQLIKLLDYACARPLPVAFSTDGVNLTPYELGRATNINFKEGNIQPLIVMVNNGDVTNMPAVDQFVQSLIVPQRDLNGDGIMDVFGWDVDTDGDGIPDGIWMDPGLPLITSPEGKILKVMSTVHIQDLDSKINVNLAGDTTQSFPTYGRALTPADGFVRNSLTDLLLTQGNGVGPAELGLFHLLTPTGFNSADPETPDIFSARIAYLKRIMKARNGGDGAQSTSANFSWTGVPGKEVEPVPNNSGNDNYSRPFERGVANTLFWGSNDARLPSVTQGGYSMQIRGRAGLGLDRYGNVTMFQPPLQNSSGTALDYLSETADDGYELNQNGAPSDRVFTLEELERILRRFDGDVNSLSDRLSNIVKRDTNWTLNGEVNRVLTTRSHELRNMQIGAASRDFNNDGNPSLQSISSVFEWLAAIYEQNYRTVLTTNQNVAETAASDPSMIKTHLTGGPVRYPFTSQSATFAPSVARALFPIEFRHGLRMNLNRPFGNGTDEDVPAVFNYFSNYVVDDPMELYARRQTEPYGTTTVIDANGFYSPIRYNFFPGAPNTSRAEGYPVDGQPRYRDPATSRPTPAAIPTLPPDVNISLESRQIFARQLYCLAQLLVPQDYRFSTMADLTGYSVGGNNTLWYKRRARTLAQWAINVVDFRDSDAIMTRFEYDYLPFGARSGGSDPHTPASVNGFAKDPGWEPEAGDVVWGMEYPELLLTETLAFHDKRVRVRNQGTPATDKPTQFRIPQGSLFIELISTRTPPTSADNQNVPAVPKELYIDINNNTPSGRPQDASVALDLDLLAPAPPVGSRNFDYGVQPVWRIGIVDGRDATYQPIAGFQNFDAALNATSGTDARTPHYLNAPTSTEAQTVLSQTNQTSAPTVMGTTGLHSNLNDPTAQVYFDRVVWFTNYAPSQVDATANANKIIPNLRHGQNQINNRVFYNRKIVPPTDPAYDPNHPNAWGTMAHPQGSYLPLGGYLVLAPRLTTHVGSHQEPAGDKNTDNPIYSPSGQRIEVDLTLGKVIQHRLDATVSNADPLIQNNIRPATIQISQADPPTTWVASATSPLEPNEGIGLNVSEPLPIATASAASEVKYYDSPDVKLNTQAGSGYDTRRPDSYRDVSSQDAREDIFDDDPLVNPVLADGGTGSLAGTKPNFRSLYLQRLANPLAAYDPEWNPYITVDVMSVDLTVFTGENDVQDYGGVGGAIDYAFQSRYKDGRSMDGSRQLSNTNISGAPIVAAATPDRNVVKSYFSASTAALVRSILPATAPNPRSYFEYELGNYTSTNILSSTSLGYLNVGNITGTTSDGFGYPITNNGVIGQPDPALVTMTSLYWANRDFANPAELMQVPYTAPGKLSTYFTAAIGGLNSIGNALSPVLPAEDMYADSASPTRSLLPSPFGHLLGYSDTNTVPRQVTTPPTYMSGANYPPRRETHWMHGLSPSARSNLSLLMELVETTPRYADTATVMDPRAMTASATGVVASNADAYDSGPVDRIRERMLFDFRVPNNLRKSYTNPGKVNINNADSEAVWNSVEWNARANGTHRETVVGLDSWKRVVESRRGYPVTSHPLNNNINNSVPTQFAGTWRNPFNVNITPTDDALFRSSESVSATWRRSSSQTPNNRTTTDTTALLSNVNLDREQHARPKEQVANSFINMQRTGRLSNLVTNQSNVFAIWITVGLFEWDPVNGLGKEYVGTDGNTTRQRSFYMVDRTVPVAFREGNKFNTEKAILLRRNISR